MMYSKFKFLLLTLVLSFSLPSLAEDTSTESVSGAEISEPDKYASVRDTLQTCFACHGDKGASQLGTFPILAGQEFYYLYVQLKDMKKGLRASKIMSPIVAEIAKKDLKLMAMYFSEQAWPQTNYTMEDDRKASAKILTDAGQCASCHLATLKGNSRVPRLSNQHAEYLNNTMLDFKHGIRKNAPSIASLIRTFSEQEIKDLADFLASFDAE